MLHGVFVTGTDTNVGKTAVSAALMLRFHDEGTVKYWKPVQTGAGQDDDTATVLRLSACGEGDVLAPGIRLHRPLAPYLAAELSGTRIRISELEKCLADEDDDTRWVVEGIGGVLVPLNDAEFVVDLITHLGLATLIVSSSELGTINQTLLTIEALRNRTANIAGVVMVGEKNPGNRDAIERWGGVKVVAEMPRFPQLTADVLSRWVAMEFDVKGQLRSYFE